MTIIAMIKSMFPDLVAIIRSSLNPIPNVESNAP